MRPRRTIRLLTLLLLIPAVPGAGQELPLAVARQALEAAVAEAGRLGAPGGAIAVVDAGGRPVLLERLAGTFPAAAEISIGKARTAALFQRPTSVLENAINQGRTAMLGLAGGGRVMPLKGGVPLKVDGAVVGGIGVSGAASADQDEEIAVAAAAALGSAPMPAAASILDGAEVGAAFAVGRPLLETGAYKIHASRREGPGKAEVHTTDTDVFYVLEGSADFVTGGEVAEPAVEGPGEIRGPAIVGGDSRRLAAGDVVVVPAGTPHWFEAVEGPMTYFVVKVTEGGR